MGGELKESVTIFKPDTPPGCFGWRQLGRPSRRRPVRLSVG
jgi:hypothetical protein